MIAGEHHLNLEIDLLLLGEVARPPVSKVIPRLAANASGRIAIGAWRLKGSSGSSR
jgi:hypothetical protein